VAVDWERRSGRARLKVCALERFVIDAIVNPSNLALDRGEAIIKLLDCLVKLLLRHHLAFDIGDVFGDRGEATVHLSFKMSKATVERITSSDAFFLFGFFAAIEPSSSMNARLLREKTGWPRHSFGNHIPAGMIGGKGRWRYPNDQAISQETGP
jgi:hypothetical protein